jgi:hypothetical protein
LLGGIKRQKTIKEEDEEGDQTRTESVASTGSVQISK